MLCASGFEFEEKLHLARLDYENVQRAFQLVSGPSKNGSKRLEDAAKRHDKSL